MNKKCRISASVPYVMNMENDDVCGYFFVMSTTLCKLNVVSSRVYVVSSRFRSFYHLFIDKISHIAYNVYYEKENIKFYGNPDFPYIVMWEVRLYI